MLKFTDAAIAAIRQGRKRMPPSGSGFDFGVSQLEPRVLLSGTGLDGEDLTGDPQPAVQEDTSETDGMISFSLAVEEPVATPTDLTATALSSSEIRLTWSDNSHNESGFGVWKWLSGRWRLIAEVGANGTEYVDAGLTAGTTYLYAVHAFNDFSSSELSASATGTTVPLAPTNVMATATSSSEIELSWTGSSGATGYHIERSMDGVTGWMLVGATDSFTWNMSDSGLDGETTYHYRVMAVNAGGLSAPSDVAAATTEPAPVEGPAAPASLTASVFGHKHVQLNWSLVEGATGYLIERSDNGGEWNQIAEVGADLGDYKDHWVGMDGTYAYRVRTIADEGMSVPSPEAVVTTGRPLVMTMAGRGKSFSTEPVLAMADEDESLTSALASGKGRK